MGKSSAHLKLATVKLQQSPVWKKQLPPHNGGPETGGAPKPVLLGMLSLPCCLKDDRLVRVGAPGCGGWGPGLGYDKYELLHDIFQGLSALCSSLDGCSNAVAKVQVPTGLGCDEMDLRNRVFQAYSLQQECSPLPTLFSHTLLQRNSAELRCHSHYKVSVCNLVCTGSSLQHTECWCSRPQRGSVCMAGAPLLTTGAKQCIHHSRYV